MMDGVTWALRENPHSTEVDVLSAVAQVEKKMLASVAQVEKKMLASGSGLHADPHVEPTNKLRGEWQFWVRAYERGVEAVTREEVEAAIKFAIGVRHLHFEPTYEIAKNMRQAALHILCRRLMQLKYKWDLRLRTITTPRGTFKLSNAMYAQYAEPEFRRAHAEILARGCTAEGSLMRTPPMGVVPPP